MEGFRPKTHLEQLESKARGIAARLRDPSVSAEEKQRAQVRLEETRQEIHELRNPPEKKVKGSYFVKSY
ncbi:MAG: hypothetical protein HYS60_02030 [Candidatus Wildermuthbacteria bacterium]|nr:hypothetical protein [Candidatus Wildermuthbacteria bacterium]